VWLFRSECPGAGAGGVRPGLAGGPVSTWMSRSCRQDDMDVALMSLDAAAAAGLAGPVGSVGPAA